MVKERPAGESDHLTRFIWKSLSNHLPLSAFPGMDLLESFPT
jgi:hypothetical protein